MIDAALAGAGADAAEAVLRDVYRIDVAKALDPLHPRDFVILCHRLARSLAGVSRADDAKALRAALAKLDVDWKHLTIRGRAKVIAAAKRALGDVGEAVLPRVDHVLEVAAKHMVARAKRSTIRRFDLHIAANTSKTDARIAAHVRASQGNFIRDEYRRRRDDLGERARTIVASGLERGLGRDDIVGELQSDLTLAAANRSRAYWQTLAMSFANRGRTYTQLAAFDEAAIETYRYEAVMDEVTSQICRFLNGREFSVERAMKRFEEVETLRDPDDITDAQPWVQVGADDAGHQVLFFKRGDRRHVVAHVEGDTVGERDARGSYSHAMTNAELEAAGVTCPPAHGHCRSSIVAL